MQNLDKKASILIWAIMLSLLVSISFISISTKINKNIKLSGETSTSYGEREIVSSALLNQINTQISENKVIVFEDTFDRKIPLKHSEILELSFSGVADFNIDLGIINGGAIYYHYKSNNVISHSGVLNYSTSFSGTFDGGTQTGALILENLGGYSEILINSENSFESPQKKYKIVQTVGNNKLIQTKAHIQ